MSRLLYPSIQPYQTGFLSVSEQQKIYYEQSGDPSGIPVVYLHGGPGAGSNKNFRCYFNPDVYRIIQFDQRGCGQSLPSPSIEHNDVAHLLADMEQLRQQLSIEKWLVAGGSWGSTLALLYGIAYPQRVTAFLLRGIFLGTTEEYNWLYHDNGAARFFPEYYQEFLAPLQTELQTDPLSAYHELLNSTNEIAATAAGKAWYLWESRLSSIENFNLAHLQVEDTHQALCTAKISSHYFFNHCFIEPDFIVNHLNRIEHIPATIVHGRYDMVCQLHYAHLLTQHWQNAKLHIMPCAGHSGLERQTVDAMCKAADQLARFLSEHKE